jgi:hypothetical protein
MAVRFQHAVMSGWDSWFGAIGRRPCNLSVNIFS